MVLAWPGGLRFVRVGVHAGDDLLAPHDLARGGAAGPPAVGELADDQEAAAVLVVVGGVPQAGQGGRVVEDLADQGALQEEAQLDRLVRGVPERVGDQLGDDQLGRVDQVLQIPLSELGADQAAGAADGGGVGRQGPGRADLAQGTTLGRPPRRRRGGRPPQSG